MYSCAYVQYGTAKSVKMWENDNSGLSIVSTLLSIQDVLQNVDRFCVSEVFLKFSISPLKKMTGYKRKVDAD